ncbi:hypothetical protein PJIAN_1334 [Paludibacter jiangxiensis]|uniref:Uncharacterized protein n=2 Tax=Paludibacter jiangxiensis TaxID=681398 RepID=A0A170YEU3_9BACT|nr:hypothetical protein PJIAN_1334 [Paludibacter jiangxiensis]
MEIYPDSALKLLNGIKTPRQLSSKDYALYSFAMTQALDKALIIVQSDSLIKNAVTYYADGKDPMRAGYSYFYLSRCERNQGNPKGQAESLLKAIPYAIKSNNYKLLGFIYSEKASIYREQNQIDSMIHYNKLSYNSLKRAKDQRNCIVSLIGIGYGYYQLQQFSTALKYYYQAEHEAQDSKDSTLLAPIYKFSSLALFYLKDYTKSSLYAKQGIAIEKQKDPSNWFNLAAIFAKQNKLDSAKIYLSKCISHGYKAPDCYELFEDIFEQERNFQEAIKYAKLTINAKDSTNKAALLTSFAGMEKKYNYERIATENKTLIIANQRNKIAVLFLLLGLSGIIVIVLLWRYRHKQVQLKQHQLLVEKEKENNQLLQQQINMQNALIKNVEHHKKTAIKRLVPNTSSYSTSEEGSVDSMALYDELISSIDGLYNGFSKRLKNKYPLLTTTDILICCLLRAGFESGMIASVLDTQTDSFNVRRARLRKKLEIEHGMNFSDFLADF